MESLTLDSTWNKQEPAKRILSPDYDPAFWSRYFHTYDILLRVIPYRELLQSLVEAAGLRPGQSILDAGCGTGNLGNFLPENVQLHFLDQSVEALKRAGSKYPGARVVQGSLADKLPHPDASLDAIVCNNVLYTLPETAWPGILKECHRVLRPGARLVLSNPSTGFSPLAIYRAHIRESIEHNGWSKTLAELITLFIPTLRMFLYNGTILREEKDGEYHFFERGEQASMLSSTGFWVDKPEQGVYAGQAWMVVGIKRY